MIEDAPIVRDIRKIRCAISQQFDDDLEQYIDYLRSQPQVILESDKQKQSYSSLPHCEPKSTRKMYK